MLANKPGSGARPIGRRAALLAGPALLTAAFVRPSIAVPLAPLGPVTRIGGDKLMGLTVDEVKDVLRRDIADNMYFVTGNLTRELFADNCR